MSQKKLTEAEIGLLKNLQTEFDTVKSNLGQIETQLQSVLLQKETAVEKLKTIFTEEQELADKLKDKYGEGTVDLANGVFTPAE
jgi:flagellar biosynthesis chaperone FliJ